MEKYKKEIERRMSLLTAFIGGLTTVIVVTTRLEDKITETNFLSFVHGFKLGTAILFMTIAMFSIGKYSRCLKDEVLLKEYYIAETDERLLEIDRTAGGYFVKITLGILYIVTYLSAYFNPTVFFTLLAVLLFIAVLRLVTYVVYRKKLS